ncbi:unnamed protein product [Cylindrotheca closterium]|uniref:Uncharacterized protein n=1 Tax=Cylindrotheca closterium TaxID=2856 RepID=A0AAD2FJM0_9STRA|nr:unnamed protein product [Cylindrotheca closterium]
MTSFPKLLGPESPQMGTQFLSSVSICFSDDSIHKAIHDKKRPKKSEIQASFGFAVPTGKPYLVYGRGRKESVTAETFSADAIRFNAPQMLSTDKLRLLNSSRVGAVLGVFFTPNSPPVIGFGASPVSTTFNGQDAVHRGAPKWSDCFDATLIQQYWQGDMSVPTHSLVVFLSGKTRLKMLASHQDFVQATKPAMLVGDFSKVLLIPDGCGALVGLYWPTSISFKDFKNSLSGHGTPYGSFLDLLRRQSSIFEEWFTAVNSSAGSYQLQTTSAMDLWATLPCPSNLHRNGLLNVAAAQPLREQFARYVMGMALVCALFGPCGVDDQQAIRQRCQVGAWLERARQCYPPALGYHAPPEHFAYLSVLYVLNAMQKVRAFQEQIVHGTSAGTPANPVDLVADVKEYDICPNDLATRFASSANDSSTAAVMQAGNIADRRCSSLAQGRFGAGPQTGLLGLAPMRNDMFNLQTLAASLGVRQSCFVSADKASLASRSNPICVCSDDRVVAGTDWMKVPELTQLARDLIVVWDHGHKEATSGVTRTLHYALRFHTDIATDFQQIPLPYEAEFDLLNFAMHKSICDVARWKMGRKVPPPPVGGPSWHIFHLLPLVNSTYGGTCIPPGGLPIVDTQLFGKYVFLLMLLFGSQEDATMDQIYGGDYDDSVFWASLFGQNLLHLCKLPQHTAVVRLWRCRPRQCTLQWMEDLCALFGEVTAMVRYRSGAAPTTLGLQDATFHGKEDIVAGAFVVAPTMVGRHEFTKKALFYLDKFQLLYERVERKWDPAELDVNGHTWSHSFSSSFFGTAIPPILPPRGPDPFRHGVSDGVQPCWNVY